MHVIELAIVAAFAISALATAAASAAGGPDWWVKKSTVIEKLEAPANAGIEAAEPVAEFKFTSTIRGVTGTIKCSVVTLTPAELMGGVPGTDKATPEFTGCKGQGLAAACEVKSATGVREVIGPYGANSALVFAEGVRNHADDRFLPPSGGTFVSFKLASAPGMICPSVGEVHVKGCVLAELWQGGKVAAEKALAKEDELNFPEPAIEKYEVWNGTAWEKRTCNLTTQFEAEAEKAATQAGKVKTRFTREAAVAGYEEAGWIKE